MVTKYAELVANTAWAMAQDIARYPTIAGEETRRVYWFISGAVLYSTGEDRIYLRWARQTIINWANTNPQFLEAVKL